MKLDSTNGFKLTRGKIIGIVILLVVLIIGLSRCGGEKRETAEWPADGLAALLPDPVGTVESVDTDDEKLDATFRDCSQDDYDAYLDACKEMGYTVDAEVDAIGGYSAYSEDGHHLELTYRESSEDIDVTLEAPLELTEIVWPTRGAGSLVPAPESATGLIDSDSSTFFFAYVGNTDEPAFSAYVNACTDAGFDVDYDKGDTWYYAYDNAGNYLSLNYQGFNIMTVRLDAADEEDAVEETGEPVDGMAETEPDDTSEVSSDFKATMDSYEAFFDEYIEFMKLYSENPSDTELLGQYADYMDQYTETMEAMSSIDADSLSPADYAYYIEVQNRINEKLMDAAL